MAGPTRIEADSLGEVEVPADRLWGAQTQRSLENFPIGGARERMPIEVVRALALVKRAAAQVNQELGLLDAAKAQAIVAAADEVIAGRHDDEFPLVVWQTGSGTQTNMNVNEVVANRASELLGGPRGKGRLVHPNDDVNHGQSSNDVFPTAMHVAAVQAIEGHVVPALRALRDALAAKAADTAGVVKIGRTHLMDATPLTLGQEIGGWGALCDAGLAQLERTLPGLRELAIGGTAVGTGLNTHPEFGARVAAELARVLGTELVSAPNKFAALSAHDALVYAHGALKTVATSLLKIAEDVRWLASGPRSGLGEITIPENEPGSSIMPGKVNPTQSEALIMVAARVLANDVAVNLGGALGNFELNVMKPLVASAFLQSATLLADAASSFTTRCITGLAPNRPRIYDLLARSLMLVTALAPHIGYDAAARIARHAHEHNLTLREAALTLGLVTPADFDTWVRPDKMV